MGGSFEFVEKVSNMFGGSQPGSYYIGYIVVVVGRNVFGCDSSIVVVVVQNVDGLVDNNFAFWATFVDSVDSIVVAVPLFAVVVDNGSLVVVVAGLAEIIVDDIGSSIVPILL